MTVGFFALAWIIPSVSFAASGATFPDVLESHPAYSEIEDLVVRGYVQGNPDGTFKPDELVSRAAALKLIIAPIADAKALGKNQKSVYDDVSNLEWYFPYVAYAQATIGIIDEPPLTTKFFPERTVTKGEFLKMLLLAHNSSIDLFQSIQAPFASDGTNMDEWYIPYTRYGVSASLFPMDSGNLEPGKELTRADAAVLLSWFLQYQEGLRTDVLNGQTEEALITLVQYLGKRDVRNASFYSSRAMLTAYGASRSAPEERIVQGNTKLAEGFWFLVLAWHQIGTRQWQAALQNILGAATRAEQARSLDPSLNSLVLELERLAQTMALEVKTGIESENKQ